MSEDRRINVRLGPELSDKLDKLKDKYEASDSEVVRSALALADWYEHGFDFMFKHYNKKTL